MSISGDTPPRPQAGNNPTSVATPAERGTRAEIISAVTTPLGFFVLVVLVIEALMSTFAIGAPYENRAQLLLYIFILAAGLVAVVTGIAVFRPDALYGRRSNLDEEIIRSRLASPKISVDEAIAKSERFAQLISSLIIIKTLYMSHRGYNFSNNGVEYIMTDLRKRMYGYKAIFGTEIVEGKGATISALVGAVLNNKTTIDQITTLVGALLLYVESTTKPDAADSTLKVIADEIDDTDVDTTGIDQEFLKKYIRIAQRTELAMSTVQSEQIYDKITNLLWREFSNAINNGGKDVLGKELDYTLDSAFSLQKSMPPVSGHIQ